jgi:hypothetical protein
MLGCNVFRFNFLQFDCPAHNDELVTGGVVRSHQFIYFHPHFFLGEGVKLSEMHVILNDFQQQKERLADLVRVRADDDVTPDDAKVAHELVLEYAGLSTHSIDENTGFEVVRHIMANRVVFIALI